MENDEAQKIYNRGYNQGKEDMDARFRIGSVYAKNHQIRDLRAIQMFVRKNEAYSDEYKRGYTEAIDRYIGVIDFSRKVDKTAILPTLEEQARIVRNRLEQRYRDAASKGKIDHKSYTQITVCIDTIYEELFMAGFNVGCGELIGPQKITLNKED